MVNQVKTRLATQVHTARIRPGMDAAKQWGIATVAVALMIVGGCAREGEPRMVEVHGYRIRMLVQGHGSPAVVFINAGMDRLKSGIASIQPSAGSRARLPTIQAEPGSPIRHHFRVIHGISPKSFTSR